VRYHAVREGDGPGAASLSLQKSNFFQAAASTRCFDSRKSKLGGSAVSYPGSFRLFATLFAVFVLVSKDGSAGMEPPEPLDFIAVLHASGPASDRSEELGLYGQFIGDWHADVVSYGPDGARHEGKGEIHFGWILQGRAVQDVWMIPRLEDRAPSIAAMPVAGNWYGTTIRVYDTTLKAWRIYWIDPATNTFRQQIARRNGADIIQEGTTEQGALSRWSFTEITSQSFHWKGEGSFDKGATWRLFVEVFAHRVDVKR